MNQYDKLVRFNASREHFGLWVWASRMAGMPFAAWAAAALTDAVRETIRSRVAAGKAVPRWAAQSFQDTKNQDVSRR